MIHLLKPRSILFLLSFVFVFNLTSCGTEDKGTAHLLNLIEQTQIYTVETSGLSFTANLNGNEELYIVAHPKELSGLKAEKINEGQYEVNYDGITTVLPSSALTSLTDFGATVLAVRKNLKNTKDAYITETASGTTIKLGDFNITVCYSTKNITELTLTSPSKTTNYKILTEDNTNDKQSRSADRSSSDQN